jgi:hypothetical protein
VTAEALVSLTMLARPVATNRQTSGLAHGHSRGLGNDELD